MILWILMKQMVFVKMDDTHEIPHEFRILSMNSLGEITMQACKVLV